MGPDDPDADAKKTPNHIVGKTGKEVLCVFLGKVWKMQSAEQPSATADCPPDGKLTELSEGIEPTPPNA